MTAARFLTLLSVAALLLANQPLALADKSSHRSGIWVTQKLPTDEQSLTELSSGLTANHLLKGVSLHIAWAEIEKEGGKPDFTRLDRTLAILRDARMPYQFCLKPGATTPAFVYADGAAAFQSRVRNPHRANVGAPVRIPLPWDPVFERDFSRIITQLGQRYATDPLCVGVVLTCANFMSAEMHLPKGPEDLARWRAFGNYDQRLFHVYAKFTDVWAGAFPKQELSLHVSKVLDLPPSFVERIINYGLNKYPDRYSIQNCQLTGRKEDTGVMTYDLIQRYRDRVHHGFQSLAGLNRPDGRMGSAEMAALNIVHAGGEFWELWHGDGFDPEVASHANKVWQEAKELGYDAYKRKLIADGKYRAGR